MELQHYIHCLYVLVKAYIAFLCDLEINLPLARRFQLKLIADLRVFKIVVYWPPAVELENCNVSQLVNVDNVSVSEGIMERQWQCCKKIKINK